MAVAWHSMEKFLGSATAAGERGPGVAVLGAGRRLPATGGGVDPAVALGLAGAGLAGLSGLATRRQPEGSREEECC